MCPTNWHISTDYDWMELEIFSGMPPLIALETNNRGEQAMELKSSVGWGSLADGFNTTGFNALPGGDRVFIGNVAAILGCEEGFFQDINDRSSGLSGGWWTPYGSNSVARFLTFGAQHIQRDVIEKQRGLSIRCIKDSE